MLAAWFLVFSRESISELRAFIDQELADFGGGSQLEPTQKIDAARLGHIAVDVHGDPTCCPIDGAEHVAAQGLVRHLRQVLDIDVDDAEFIVVEGLPRRDLLALGSRNQVRQARHALTS